MRKNMLDIGIVLISSALIFVLMVFVIHFWNANLKAEQSKIRDDQHDNSYVGLGKCKMCHLAIYKDWLDSKKAKAFDVLKENERKDPKCLSCHTTAYGVGGYDPNKSAEENKKFEGVTCEACHGPGGEHIKAEKRKKKETIISGSAVSCNFCHVIHASHPEIKDCLE